MSTLTNTTHAGLKMQATASTKKISGTINATSSTVTVKISNNMTTKATSLEEELNASVKIFIKMTSTRSMIKRTETSKMSGRRREELSSKNYSKRELRML